jgi:hypothetical protein
MPEQIPPIGRFHEFFPAIESSFISTALKLIVYQGKQSLFALIAN